MSVDRIAYGTRKGSEVIKWRHICGRCGAHISIFETKCRECGAEFDMDKPYVRHLNDLTEEKVVTE